MSFPFYFFLFFFCLLLSVSLSLGGELMFAVPCYREQDCESLPLICLLSLGRGLGGAPVIGISPPLHRWSAQRTSFPNSFFFFFSNKGCDVDAQVGSGIFMRREEKKKKRKKEPCFHVRRGTTQVRQPGRVYTLPCASRPCVSRLFPGRRCQKEPCPPPEQWSVCSRRRSVVR